MAKEKVVSGIDIGSSKVSTIIASVSEEEKASVIGVSTVPSRGIKKGVVVDIDSAVEAIADSLEAAERMAGYAVSSAYVTVGGKHISSINSHGVVAVSAHDSEITEADVGRVTEAARAISIPNSREIIHVIPRGFVVDSQEGVKDPVGMSGVRLEVETNIISGSTTVMRNLVKCLQRVGVDVEDLVFTGIASAEAVLTETERELGTMLVDIGGGTTSICIFTVGSPVYSSVIPIGGQNITNDLAVGLRVSLDDAEKIKLRLTEHYERVKEHKHDRDAELDVSDMGLEIDKIPVGFLENIIEARLMELFNMVALEVKNSSQQGALAAGIVVTGGGALTAGLKTEAKKVLRMPLRVGSPVEVGGLIDEISTPVHSSLTGLVLYGAYFEGEGRTLPGIPSIPFLNSKKFSQGFQKMVKWGRSFLP